MTLPPNFVKYGRFYTADAAATAAATAATTTAADAATAATAAAAAATAATAAAYAYTAYAAYAAYADTAITSSEKFKVNMKNYVTKTKFTDEQIAVVQKVYPKWQVAQIKLLFGKEMCIYLGFPIEVVGQIEVLLEWQKE